MNTLEDRYFNKLISLPPSGGGGCHTGLLGVANAGVRAGFDDHQILDDIREFIDDTRRPVSDEEILEAIDKARSDGGYRGSQHPRQAPRAKATPQKKESLQGKLRGLLRAGQGVKEDDFLRASPVAIPEKPQEQTVLTLEELYHQNDILFLGDTRDAGIPRKTIHKAGGVLEFFRRGVKAPPHIIPNPLSGKAAPTRSGGKDTYRGDRCVSQFRMAVVEFDNLTRDEQLAFWATASLPVYALIDSGGKSIHGWIAIDGIHSLEQWDIMIKEEFYGQYLIPLGVDGACSNAARLSRLPGHLRNTGRYQRLLYLNPQGGMISL